MPDPDEQVAQRHGWLAGLHRAALGLLSILSRFLGGPRATTPHAHFRRTQLRASWAVGLLLVLVCSPHVAAATESVIELSEERAAPCCPLEAEAPPEPEDCSRTCRSCHCCLPVLVLGMLVPEVSSPVTTLVSEPFAAQTGGLLPAHTRTLFRPPAA